MVFQTCSLALPPAPPVSPLHPPPNCPVFSPHPLPPPLNPAFHPTLSFPLSLPPHAYKGLMCNAGVQGWAEQAARHVEEVATFRAGGLPASVRTIAHCGFTGTVAYSLTGWLPLSPCLALSHCVRPVCANPPARLSLCMYLCLS